VGLEIAFGGFRESNVPNCVERDFRFLGALRLNRIDTFSAQLAALSGKMSRFPQADDAR
jgi:hypothetical protein